MTKYSDASEQFREGYATAILWANCYEENEAGECEPVERYIDPNEITVDTDEANDFFSDNYAPMLALVESDKCNWSQHGVDLALTRNGHGAGFWDRGYGEAGIILAAHARVYGEHSIYID